MLRVLKSIHVSSFQDPNAKGSLEHEQQLNLLSIEHEGELLLYFSKLKLNIRINFYNFNNIRKKKKKNVSGTV
mgnify:CR=1 FL=1